MTENASSPRASTMSRQDVHQILWTYGPAEAERLTGMHRDAQRRLAKRCQIEMPPRGYFRRSEKRNVPPLAPFVPPAVSPVVQINASEAMRRLDREELYTLVWARPATKVAADLGVSGKGLAKRARVVGVPMPPRGYWAKQDAGHPVQMIPLPPAPADYDARRDKERAALDGSATRSIGNLAFAVLAKEALKELVWSMAMPAIAMRFSVTRAAVRARCKSWDIDTPPRGHWRKAAAKSGLDGLQRSAEFRPDTAHSPTAIANSDGSAPNLGTALEFSVDTLEADTAAMSEDRFRDDSVETRIEAFLASYEVPSPSRRSQLQKGLSALRARGVSTTTELIEAAAETVKDAVGSLAATGQPINSVRMYRSAVLNFQAFLRQEQSAVEGAPAADIQRRDAELDMLLDESSYASRFEAWEILRDISIIRLIVDDGLQVQQLIEFERVGREPLKKMFSPGSSSAISRYLTALPASRVGVGTQPLFVTGEGTAMYREFPTRRLAEMSEMVGVQRFKIKDLQFAHRRRHRASLADAGSRDE